MLKKYLKLLYIMNDIYAQKAKKYKYKYLKLKKELEGGDDFKFIGYGGFGCIISPPIKFNITTIDEKIFTSKDYVAKLLSYEAFLDEKKEFEEIEGIDHEGNHRSKLIYAEKMKKKDLKKAGFKYIPKFLKGAILSNGS